MLQGVYSVVKQGSCCVSEVATSKCFTAQAALWEAPSAYNWEKAIRGKHHFDINGMEFAELLERGTRGDVDDMGLLMMVTCLGLTESVNWLLGVAMNLSSLCRENVIQNVEEYFPMAENV